MSSGNGLEDEEPGFSIPAGALNVRIKGEDYLVRAMRPSSGASLHELQLSLQRNRDLLADSFEAMKEACRDDLFKRKEKKDVDYFSPTMNALVARANIDMLIPLINIKGGEATYKSKLEAMPIEQHIEKLRKKALKKVNEEDAKDTALGFFMILLVIAIMAVLLYLFL